MHDSYMWCAIGAHADRCLRSDVVPDARGGGQAEGQRLDIVAAENVRLLAGECVVTDLCAAAAFADRLQRALQ